MARINPLPKEAVSPSLQEAFDKHTKSFKASITNMKATLAHSPLSFEVYMQWYPLYEKVKQITGERTAALFAWSVSNASNCPLCSTYFRKFLAETGEDPESLHLNEYEQSLLEFGSAISQHKGCIANHVYNNVAAHHTTEEMVVLIAFAGQMIATNIFNNVTETEIDDYLIPFLPAKYFV